MEPPRRRKPYKGVPYLQKTAHAEKNYHREPNGSLPFQRKGIAKS